MTKEFAHKTIHSFRYAGKGVAHALGERNMKIHLVAVVVVVVVGLVLGLSWLEWAAVVICSGLVISMEVMNTALERLCDALVQAKTLPYESAGLPKDLAAGGVLVAAGVSVVVAALIVARHIQIGM